MRKVTMFLLFAILIVFVGNTIAEITFHGDARVRPRLDQSFSDGEKTNQDLYYMYWMRLWAKATLTDGWYAVAKLAADGPGDWIGVFGKENPDKFFSGTFGKEGHWDRNSGNGVVRFNQAYFGKDGKTAGFSMGLLPFNCLANPELDFHFFPGTRSDISYIIYNQASATGFRGYYKLSGGTLNATVTVDDNNSIFVGDSTRDQYSVLLNYEKKINGVSVQPTLIKTFGAEDMSSPLTAGVNFALPKFKKTAVSGGLYFSNQSVAAAGKYDGYFVHAKVVRPAGPGTLVLWGDFSSIDFDGGTDRLNSQYIWLMYKLMVYKSDVGSLAVMPTYRIIAQNEYSGVPTYKRNKIEVTFHFTFK